MVAVAVVVVVVVLLLLLLLTGPQRRYRITMKGHVKNLIGEPLSGSRVRETALRCGGCCCR